jgi:tripartite-type tricarboxylate transporter receptor subunit TctC
MFGRLVAVLLLLPCIVFAQGYPAKPVRVIVPFPPGGTTDLIARIVQPKFQDHLGQNVVIDNKGGAGGSIGAAEAARSAADGYTLLLVFDTHAVNHHLYKQAPDPFKTLEHIMLMVASPSTLVAGSSFSPKTMTEVVERAKAEPGKVTYASTGHGSSNHLGALLLEQAAGIRMTHVPYKGGGPMVAALLGNQVDVAFISTPLILPHIQAGKVKPIAVGGKSRIAVLPNVPTAARVQEVMKRTLETPEVRKALSDRGFEVIAGPPEEFLRFVRAESDKLGRLIRDNQIQVD